MHGTNLVFQQQKRKIYSGESAHSESSSTTSGLYDSSNFSCAMDAMDSLFVACRAVRSYRFWFLSTKSNPYTAIGYWQFGQRQPIFWREPWGCKNSRYTRRTRRQFISCKDSGQMVWRGVCRARRVVWCKVSLVARSVYRTGVSPPQMSVLRSTAIAPFQGRIGIVPLH